MQASNNNPIGIFDSGVGGLSILKQIATILPNENLLYFADSAYAPYGEKSTDFIKSRCKQLSQYLIKHKAKALVIACNTATTEAIADIRSFIDIPVIGVEPAIKPATKLTKTKNIGVMATQRTINSSRYSELLKEHAGETTVYNSICYELAEIIERHPEGNQRSLSLIKKYTQTMRKANVDIIVLGCTHYPFLRAQIKKIAGENVSIIETGTPVALQVLKVLAENNLSNSSTHQGKVSFFSSLNNKSHIESICQLWGEKVEVSPVNLMIYPPNKSLIPQKNNKNTV